MDGLFSYIILSLLSMTYTRVISYLNSENVYSGVGEVLNFKITTRRLPRTVKCGYYESPCQTGKYIYHSIMYLLLGIQLSHATYLAKRNKIRYLTSRPGGNRLAIFRIMFTFNNGYKQIFQMEKQYQLPITVRHANVRFELFISSIYYNNRGLISMPGTDAITFG